MEKRRFKLLVALIIGVIALIGPLSTVSAATTNHLNSSATSDSNLNVYDLYLNQESETVFIEGNSYTYDYSYEGNNKTIYITNNADNSVEKVSYNEDNSTIYYNDKVLSTVKKDNNIKLSDSLFSTYSTTSATNTWVTVSSSSTYVSWAKGISAAALAAVIAVPLAGLGAAGVIAAMGMGALGVLAAGAIGGTVKMTLQRFTPTFGAPYHRYLWSFKASTGDYYGQYIYSV